PAGDARLAFLEWAWLTGQPERAALHLTRGLAELPGDRHHRLRAELIRYGQRAGLVSDTNYGNLPEPWATAVRGDWFAASVGFQSQGEDYQRGLEPAASGRR